MKILFIILMTAIGLYSLYNIICIIILSRDIKKKIKNIDKKIAEIKKRAGE